MSREPAWKPTAKKTAAAAAVDRCRRLARAAAVLAPLAAFGCITHHSNDNKRLGGSAGADSTPVVTGEQVNGNVISMTATSAYQMQPVDVLILKEGSAMLSPQAAYGLRLASAAPVLAARLSFTAVDFNLAFADIATGGGYADGNGDTGGNYAPQGSSLDDATPTPTVAPTDGSFPSPTPTPDPFALDQTGGAAILGSNSASLRDLVTKRMNEDASQALPFGYTFTPLAAMRHILTENAAAFERPGAFLAVVFLQTSVEQSDDSAADATTWLNSHRGANTWSVSTLSLDATTDQTVCGGDDQTPASALTPAKATATRALATTSRGSILSVCSPSYATFFDQLVTAASHQQYFNLPLTHQAMYASIVVKVGGTVINGWQYQVGTKVLALPRTIAFGQPMAVTYTVDDGSKPNPQPPTAAAAQAAAVTAAQTQFTSKIEPILAANCDGAGCHGTGAAQTVYVNNFKAARTDRGFILDRITRPAADPQLMPKGKTLSAADLATLNAWLSLQ